MAEVCIGTVREKRETVQTCLACKGSGHPGAGGRRDQCGWCGGLGMVRRQEMVAVGHRWLVNGRG